MGDDRDLSQRREADGMKLALVRTELSNRRTLLAYIKTALAILAGGLALIHLNGLSQGLVMFGWSLLPLAGIVLVLGVRDYLTTRALIRSNKTDAGV